MKLGQFEIGSFVEQKFRLDGGSMFGVIPKSMWQRLIPADENNLIPMVTNLFVLRAHGKNIIFDIGLGDCLGDREKKIYGTDGVSNLEAGLQSFDLSPEQIDYVIITHLHTDHCGGAVKRSGDGYVPRFPNARYVIDRSEWELAINPDERTSAVYVPDRLLPLEVAGQVDFIDGDSEILPGIKAVRTGGHTSSHFAIEIESDGQKCYYYADVFPSSAHVKVPFVPATDLYPLDTMAVKRRTLPRLIEEEVILAFDHDINMPFGRVKQDGKKLFVEPTKSV